MPAHRRNRRYRIRGPNRQKTCPRQGAGVKPKCRSIVRVENPHRRNPLGFGGWDQLGKARLNRWMGKAVARIDAETARRQGGDLGVYRSVHLAAAQVLAIVVKPIEPVTLKPRQLGVQNCLGEIGRVAWGQPASGQGGSDQIARSRDSQHRHEAAFAAKEALSREQRCTSQPCSQRPRLSS